MDNKETDMGMDRPEDREQGQMDQEEETEKASQGAEIRINQQR